MLILKIDYEFGVQMRENVYQLGLCMEARLRIYSGELLVVDPVFAKHVKCDWFKRFAPPSEYDSARKNRIDMCALRERVPDMSDVSSRISTLTARQVERIAKKLSHYRDLSHRIEESRSDKYFAPPRLVQGQHGVYFRTGEVKGTYDFVTAKTGYAVLIDAPFSSKILGEVCMESGMLVLIDGREIVKFESGVNFGVGCRIKVPKGAYICSFSKDKSKLSIRRKN
jgi:hypothetical protein